MKGFFSILLVAALAVLPTFGQGVGSGGPDDIGTLPRPEKGPWVSGGGSGPGPMFFGDDDISSLPRPWKGPQVSGGSGGSSDKKKVADDVLLKAGEVFRGFVDVKNKPDSDGKVKVQPMKTGGLVTGHSDASFEVDKLSAGEVVNVGVDGHADISGSAGTVNLASGASASVTNTGAAGTITVTVPGGSHTDFGPGQSGTVYAG